jgi:hypothetical protein
MSLFEAEALRLLGEPSRDDRDRTISGIVSSRPTDEQGFAASDDSVADEEGAQ